MALILETLADGKDWPQQQIIEPDGLIVSARAGNVYRIVDSASTADPLPAQVRRVGDDLEIQIPPSPSRAGGAVVIDDFYFVCRFDYRSCALDLQTLGAEPGTRITADQDTEGDARSASIQLWPTTATAPQQNQTVAKSANFDDGLEAAAGNSASPQEPAAATTAVSTAQTLPGWQILAGGLGAVALLGAAAGGGGGSNGNSGQAVNNDPALAAPPPPVINKVASDDRIDATEARSAIEVSGEAGPGELVTITFGVVQQSVTAAADGSFSASFEPSVLPQAGSYDIVASTTDSNGVVSALATRAIVIEPVPLQTVQIEAAVDNVALLVGELASGASSNDALPVLVGSLGSALIADDAVVIYRGTSAVGQAEVDGTLWRFASELLDQDDYEFTARIEDVNGGTIAASTEGFELTIDTTAPDRPSLDRIEGNNVISANEAANGIRLTGSAEAGSRVSAVWGQSTRTAVADDDGDYSLTFADIPDGIQFGRSTITVSAIDDAGNTSATRARVVFVAIQSATDSDASQALAYNTDSSSAFSGQSLDTLLNEPGSTGGLI